MMQLAPAQGNGRRLQVHTSKNHPTGNSDLLPGPQAAFRRTDPPLSPPGQTRFLYRDSADFASSRVIHATQEGGGRGARQAPDSRARVFKPQSPGGPSKTHCRTSPGLCPPPHRLYQCPLDSLCQGSSGPSVQYAGLLQQEFAGRCLRAKPQLPPTVSPPGPKVQALALSSRLTVQGPGRSPPQHALCMPRAIGAQHTPARSPRIGMPKKALQPEVIRGPGGRCQQPQYTLERGGRPRLDVAADQASRSSPALPAFSFLGRSVLRVSPPPRAQSELARAGDHRRQAQ
ncbi:hypothetical protein NDU88_001014 [Pleurodeles waltl]|uniref:Uncharacterized protein n=1 Tax=Pleurodeles waltl TaxID=8319 RepID=A0AAV7VYV9_PLEWA|nr:hypothetical protein NDU88_001014 [Pleurodeles waltl]